MEIMVNPLRSEPPEEVPLGDAPLVRVLAQVRFPVVAAIQSLATIAPFQEAIGDEYPVLKHEQVQTVEVGSSTSSMQVEQIWRFTDISEDWRVSLAPTFVALETTAYVSRTDFLGRLGRIVKALTGPLEPKAVERFGLRYINRIRGSHLDEIAALICEPLRGIIDTPLQADARHTITDTLFDAPVEQARFRARWGYLPAKATIDPTAMEPIDEASWVLDLDVSTEPGRKPFDPQELSTQAGRFASRSYTFFRWAVSDRFLELYRGGND